MNRTLLTKFGIALLVLSIINCGWKPEVTAVPLTAPWLEMELPVKNNCVVWKSEPNEFRAVHKEDKKTIAKNYVDALKAQGWQLGKFDQSGDRYYLEMTKGGEKLDVQFYDFSNTGVVITKL